MDLDDELGPVVADIVRSKLNDASKRDEKLFNALKQDEGISVIPEIKLSSPDHGGLGDVRQISNLCKIYEEEGGKAISILTEPKYFNGKIEQISMVKKKTGLPILAKGFFLDMPHLVECMLHGADSYLLMIRILKCLDRNIYDHIRMGYALGMEPFVEISNSRELKTALKIHPRIIALNNRDIYGDLSIDFERVKICRNIPDDIAVVSASGVSSGEDIRRLHELSKGRIDAVLVGSSMMKADSPREKLRELVDVGGALG
ncbi:MAG: indole-3-glycerol-phosphate synthase [Thermoplasmata archaeon]